MPQANQSQDLGRKGMDPLQASAIDALSIGRDMLAKSPKVDESLASKSRTETKSVLAEGASATPPVAPSETEASVRKELIDRLGLMGQYEERMDSMVGLIGRGIFRLKEAEKGKDGEPVPKPKDAEKAKSIPFPIPTLGAALAVFSTEQLRLAADTFQEPTLLLVPKTSFAAKVAALDAAVARMKELVGSKSDKERAKEIGEWQDTYVDGIYKNREPAPGEEGAAKADPGSEEIEGWRVVIVDGAVEIDPEGMGDDVRLTLGERMGKRSEAARKTGGAGFDRHLYAMLMLEGIMRGETIDKIKNDWRFTLLDDDPANSPSRVPNAYWVPVIRRVNFFWLLPGVVLDDSRFRRSVGGEVKP